MEKIVIVPIGIEDRFFMHPELARIRSVKSFFPEDATLILNLNRIDAHKGIHYILLSLEQLNLDKRLALIVAGKFEKKNRAYLDELLSLKRRIEDKYSNILIYFMLNVDEETKICLYDLADVFVMASPTEPFGITILESLARGTPVVVTDAEGPREIFGVGERLDKPFIEVKGGVMVSFSKEEDRPRNLALGLRYVIDRLNKFSVEAMGMIEYVRMNYSWKRIAEIFMRYYSGH